MGLSNGVECVLTPTYSYARQLIGLLSFGESCQVSGLEIVKPPSLCAMKTPTQFNLLALGGLITACHHSHDDKKWTQEELAELEAKWGFEVCLSLVLKKGKEFRTAHHRSFMLIATVGIRRDWNFCPSELRQVPH